MVEPIKYAVCNLKPHLLSGHTSTVYYGHHTLTLCEEAGAVRLDCPGKPHLHACLNISKEFCW